MGSKSYWVVVFFCAFFVSNVSLCEEPPLDLNGWSKAQWGMSEEEVLAAFQGEVTRLTNTEYYGGKRKDDCNTYAPIGIANMEIGVSVFEVVFLFDRASKKLVQVNLKSTEKENHLLLESQYDRAEKLLTEKYGPRTYGKSEQNQSPLGATASRTASWKLKKTLIEMNYEYLEGIYSLLIISYRPVGDHDKL